MGASAQPSRIFDTIRVSTKKSALSRWDGTAWQYFKDSDLPGLEALGSFRNCLHGLERRS
jgi:hypothetical protein